MKTNAASLEIIKRNEGLRLDAYQDVVGVWTIGYGDTGPDVKPGLRITNAQAEQRLAARLAREFEPGILAAIGGAETTDNEFGAMVSLAYNIGVGAFKGSSVARMHRAGNRTAAAEAFALWDKAGGQVLAGLVRRRKEEAALYLASDALGDAAIATPPSGLGPAPTGADGNDTMAPAPVASADQITPLIEALQTQLKAIGLYKDAIDGIPGTHTLAAIVAWRAAR